MRASPTLSVQEERSKKSSAKLIELECVCSCRFHWIRRIGRPVSREVAPILVSNHVSFIDPIFYFWELLPILVSSTSHDDLFLVGTIIRAMHVSTTTQAIFLLIRRNPVCAVDDISVVWLRPLASVSLVN